MNAFRQLLKSRGGRAPIGTWISSASPLVAEAVGLAGFDWGVLDMEHTPIDLGTLLQLLQAVGNTKMVPVVRVPANDAVCVKRVLDIGAQTLLFPYIQSADEARQAVASTRFAPEGVRSLSAMNRASRFGTLPDYYRNANRSVGVVVQLETQQAIAQMESIAAVPGVDALFVGPANLSANLGHAGELTHPGVMAVLADAAQRARAVGKPIGSVGSTPEVMTRYRAMGFDFMAVGSDLALLMRGCQAAVQALHTPDGSAHVHTLAEGTRTESAAG